MDYFKEVSKKSFQTVLIEAVVVGVLLIGVYIPVSYATDYFYKNFQYKIFVDLFVSGALFHLICEYTGVNLWYAQNYPK